MVSNDRLFRQRKPGDWAEVFARMAVELANLVRESAVKAFWDSASEWHIVSCGFSGGLEIH